MSEPKTPAQSGSKVSPEDVARVADMAMLNLAEGQVEVLAEQLGSVLELANAFDQFDLSSVEPVSHPFGLENVTRPDDIERLDITDSAMSQAPESQDNQFKVPPAMGEEP